MEVNNYDKPNHPLPHTGDEYMGEHHLQVWVEIFVGGNFTFVGLSRCVTGLIWFTFARCEGQSTIVGGDVQCHF